VLESSCGFRMELSGIVTPGRSRKRQYLVPFLETAAEWVDSRTKKRVLQVDFLTALAHLSSVKIRGGFLAGGESVRLTAVKLSPPAPGALHRDDLAPCCSPSGDVTVCHATTSGRAGGGGEAKRYSATLTPPGMEFECAGSQQKRADRPVLRQVFPRFAPRAGGSTVTVFGENLGIDGTQGILRVQGRASPGCVFYQVPHCVNGFLDYDEESVDCGGANCAACPYVSKGCSNNVKDGDEIGVDCGGTTCKLCKWKILAAHCLNGVQDQDEIFVDVGGVDCLPPFCSDARLVGDKTDQANNCGGTCQPCNPAFAATPTWINGQHHMAVCTAPSGSGTDETVAFVKKHPHTLHQVSSCQGEDPVARGFQFGGFQFSWRLHWAALDTTANNVRVSGLTVDPSSGEVYVAASVTKTQGVGVGRAGVMGPHLHLGGFYGRGGGVGSRDQFVVTNDATATALDTSVVYALLARISADGRPRWVTYMESQWAMEVTDLRFDAAAVPPRILLAGHFKGGYPRFFQVDPKTRLARKTTEGPECVLTRNMTNEAVCASVYTAANSATSPIVPGTSMSKVGAFLVWYDQAGVARAARTGIHFSGDTSYIDTASIRIASHASFAAQRGPPAAPVIDDARGLYLAARVVVSRLGDTLFLGRQAAGWQDIDPCKNGYFENVTTVVGNTTNSTLVCRGGVNRDKDVMSLLFSSVPASSNADATVFAVLAKFVVTPDEIGSVWARVIGEIGNSAHSSVAALDADVRGVYLTGAYTTSAVLPLRYQSCKVLAKVPECEKGGALYSSPGGACLLQDRYARAANQVCADLFSGTIASHRVAALGEIGGISSDRAGVFVAAYGHDGLLRWHREAFGGNLTARASAIVSSESVMVQEAGVQEAGAGAFLPRETPGSFLFVAGEVGNTFAETFPLQEQELLLADFGKTRFPLSCSGGVLVGNHTISPPETVCSGRIAALGSGTDIYLLKLDAASGEPLWLKRFGTRDQSEEVGGMAVRKGASTVLLSGSFSLPAGSLTRTAQDTFGVVAAGRGSAPGCAAGGEPAWSLTAQRFAYENMSTAASSADCHLTPISLASRTAFLLEVGEGDKAWTREGSTAHGGTSRPYSQCLAEGEEACNADGVLWARTLHQGVDVVATAETLGRGVAAYTDRVFVAAHFKGVRGSPHQGFRIPGLPPPAVFNAAAANTESLVLALVT